MPYVLNVSKPKLNTLVDKANEISAPEYREIARVATKQAKAVKGLFWGDLLGFPQSPGGITFAPQSKVDKYQKQKRIQTDFKQAAAKAEHLAELSERGGKISAGELEKMLTDAGEDYTLDNKLAMMGKVLETSNEPLARAVLDLAQSMESIVDGNIGFESEHF